MDETLIADLAALAKIWGGVKFYHPWLAYKDIDWDGALLAVLPRLESGELDLRGATADLLDKIGDPLTRVLGPSEDLPYFGSFDEAEPQGSLFESRNEVAVITARGLDPGGDADEQVRDALARAGSAPRLVFDLRGTSWSFVEALSRNAGLLLAADAIGPGLRSRFHSGFRPQVMGSSGGYYSAWTVKDAQRIEAKGARSVPMSFVVDRTAPPAVELAMMLARHTGGSILAVGELVEPVEVDPFEAGGVRIALRVSELVWKDGAIGPCAHTVLGEAEDPVATALSVPPTSEHLERLHDLVAAPRKDDAYEEQPYPSRELRLLGLFRYWNVIDRFFPYHHLLDVPWAQALTDFIPRFADARDATEYALTASEMAARMQDGHAGVSSKAFWEHFGRNAPDITARTVEGRLVVTRVGTDVEGLAVGDIIVTIDGEQVDDRRRAQAKVFAHSTPQGLLEFTDRWMLLGTGDVQLVIEDATGARRSVVLPRPHSIEEGWPRGEHPLPTFGMLDESIGYMDLDRLLVSEVDEALAAVAQSRALVLDMRGYPNGTAWTLGPRLASGVATAATFHRPETRDPSRQWDSMLMGYQILEPADGVRYGGRVVCLIDARAISQAEHTCLYVEAATDVTFIGSATNGTNGDVTEFWLPGSLLARFTGHDVRHGDGRQLQRVGIQPHIEVHPTIEGVRAGRDEVLEAALEFLRSDQASS